ncbi:MAG: AIR synthase related protein, partial [Lachnospiraceae bacterium]|nr:AIR synthase related protein [Lachnospiraceae bacterium]
PGVIREALCNAANNLACQGVRTQAAVITLLLPTTVEEPRLGEYMREAQEYADACDICILGGHTAAEEGLKAALVSVTALGMEQGFQEKPLCQGMSIVMSKWIGLQGTARIVREHPREVSERFPARMVRQMADFEKDLSVWPEAEIAAGFGVCRMHDVSGGGILRAAWELAEDVGVGLTLDLQRIPVKQETIETCEIFGLNPYGLLSGGALLMVTERGPELVEKLKAAQIPAQIIGQITESNDKVVLFRTSKGVERRFIDRPRTDEIEKIGKQN